MKHSEANSLLYSKRKKYTKIQSWLKIIFLISYERVSGFLKKLILVSILWMLENVHIYIFKAIFTVLNT